ncbi:sigma factor-like helix-turn-helix DNA-binding protein [Streptomyces xanthophaeus]|uniref:RNA polymerase sigma factor 70 region 4 type 2 domain-containing protein n=1 Tax=Streptomyces xanthophaeus TaxID=67385 RepID=A0A919GT49_9ACTN|nr:sigma factor-like helix-turn-helix DNA-binding protein [Streptomyces xanthophaeus]GHI84148.1 hypothetical protein Sxan_15120 [Streptomyces xanthophaeus]
MTTDTTWAAFDRAVGDADAPHRRHVPEVRELMQQVGLLGTENDSAAGPERVAEQVGDDDPQYDQDLVERRRRAVEEEKERVRQQDAEAAEGGWVRQDPGPYLDGTYTPEKPTVGERSDGEPLLYRQRSHSFSGEPNGMKSWFQQHNARVELNKGNHVVVIDLEDGLGLYVDRLQRMGVDNDAILHRLHFFSPDRKPGESAWQVIKRYAELSTLVNIDSMTAALSLFGMKTNDNDDAATFAREFIGALCRIRCLDGLGGPAVSVNDHVAKDPATRGRWAVGAGYKLGGLTGIQFGVRLVKKSSPARKGWSVITVEKDRVGEVLALCVEEEGRDVLGTFSVDPTQGLGLAVALVPPKEPSEEKSGPERPTYLMQMASEVLEEFKASPTPAPLASNAIFERIKSKGIKCRKENVLRALDILVNEGFVEREIKGQSHLHTFTKSFVDTPWQTGDQDDVEQDGASNIFEQDIDQPVPNRFPTGPGAGPESNRSTGPTGPAPSRGGPEPGTGSEVSVGEDEGQEQEVEDAPANRSKSNSRTPEPNATRVATKAERREQEHLARLERIATEVLVASRTGRTRSGLCHCGVTEVGMDTGICTGCAQEELTLRGEVVPAPSAERSELLPAEAPTNQPESKKRKGVGRGVGGGRKPSTTPQQDAAIVKLALAGETYEQIAADFKVSIGTVKNRVRDARKAKVDACDHVPQHILGTTT